MPGIFALIFQELLSNPDNIELNIKRRQPEGSATRANQPNTSNELPSYEANVAQKGNSVKRQYSFAGQNARTANSRRLAEAKALDEVNRVHQIDKKETPASIPSTDINQRSRYQKPGRVVLNQRLQTK